MAIKCLKLGCDRLTMIFFCFLEINKKSKQYKKIARQRQCREVLEMELQDKKLSESALKDNL